MSRIAVALLLSPVFVFAVCTGCLQGIKPLKGPHENTAVRGDSPTTPSLEEQIKKAQENIAIEKNETVILLKAIKDQDAQYQSKINESNERVKNISSVNDALLKSLTELLSNLTNIYLKEDDLERAPNDIRKLKLGIEVIKEDIKTFEARKVSKTEECMAVENMKKMSMLLQARGGTRINQTLAMEYQLELLENELQQHKNRNTNLRSQMKSRQEQLDLVLKEFNRTIASLEDKTKIGQGHIDRVTKELNEQIKQLQVTVNATQQVVAERAELAGKAKEQLDIHNTYLIDRQCYDKLYFDIKKLANPQHL